MSRPPNARTNCSNMVHVSACCSVRRAMRGVTPAHSAATPSVLAIPNRLVEGAAADAWNTHNGNQSQYFERLQRPRHQRGGGGWRRTIPAATPAAAPVALRSCILVRTISGGCVSIVASPPATVQRPSASGELEISRAQ